MATQKTILIAGCSQNSLGEALALESHRRKYKAIATARSVSRLLKLTSLGIDTHKLDLTSSTFITNFAAQITSLDILFNNAGANIVMPLADTTPSEFRSQFEINVFPQFELTRLLLPLLISSKGILVNHNSQSAYSLKAPAGAYAAAKAVLSCMTDVFCVELQTFGVRVVEEVTGIVASNITKFEATPRLPPGSIYEPICEMLESTMKGDQAKAHVTKNEICAKNVVSDLLDVKWWLPWTWSGQPPKWIWRGFMASIMYWFWRADTMWKGCRRGVLGAGMGMSELKKRLEEAKRRKKKIA